MLEFQAQALLDMEEARLLELKNLAGEQGVELTYSLGLDQAYDISSPDSAVRERGMEYLSAIMDRVALMAGESCPGCPMPDGAFLTGRSTRRNGRGTASRA